MRKMMLATTLLSVALSGCTVMKNELRHSGGQASVMLNRRMFVAHSKQLQLLRASVIISMASRIGKASVRDGKEATSFIGYLENATEELNFLAGHVYPVGGASPCTGVIDQPANCAAHVAQFESDLPDLEYKIVRLTIAALPQKQAAAFGNSLRGGDPLSAAWHALKLAFTALDGLHRGAAVYRSSLEVEALMLAETNSCANAAPPDAITTTERAVACLNLPDRLFSNDGAAALPDGVPEGSFNILMAIARTSCGMLPIDASIASEEESAGSNNGGDEAVTKRRTVCKKIAFKPSLRFGGWHGELDPSSPPGALQDGQVPPQDPKQVTLSPTGT